LPYFAGAGLMSLTLLLVLTLRSAGSRTLGEVDEVTASHEA
jgi:hypothetical protein